MAGGPWWMERVRGLLAPEALGALALGALWQLSERLRVVREGVEPALLALDVAALPEARGVWAAFEAREAQVAGALEAESARTAQAVRSGALGPAAFRAAWEGLGFQPDAQGPGTPADDFLDGVLHAALLTGGEARPELGTLSMASRARSIADFLEATRPGAGDVVFDLGSGVGKVALTVAASTRARVRGVELGASYVAAARASAARLGLCNVDFELGDVRAADLSAGTVFFLYYPFHGAVARQVAQALGALARARPLAVYAAGPALDFGEHFLREVDAGALRLCERRGEFGQVLVLRSAAA